MDNIGRTALWTAAIRAQESQRRDLLFNDPLAAAMAGDDGVAMLDAEPPEDRDNPYVVVRTRFFDDWLEAVVAGEGIRQVVLLAAGMDTRAFRLSWPDDMTLWELDRSAVIDLKNEILASAGATPACERRTLAVDLQDNDWPERALAAGFQVAGRSVWLAEGFFQYVEEASVARVLAATSGLAAPGSYLGADFVSRDLLVSPWMARYLSGLQERGYPWRFGTNEPEELLASHDWRVDKVVQPGENGAHYGRWPWPVVPREVPGYPRSFLVTAVRA